MSMSISVQLIGVYNELITLLKMDVFADNILEFLSVKYNFP